LAEYSYKALDDGGQTRTGTIDADSEGLAIARLREQGWVPVDLKSTRKGGMKTELRIPFLSDRIKLREIAVASRQLATMIDSGLPLMRALTVLADQADSKVLREIWETVRDDVQTGSSFSQALIKHPKAFSPLYVAVVKAGEAGGMLDETLLRLSDTLEKQVALRNKIRSAMAYPVMVAIMIVLILSAILIFVVPTFQQLYKDLGGTLPFPTQVLLLVSKIFKSYLPFVIVGAGIVSFLVRRYINTEDGRLRWDTLKLKVPVFGELFRKVAMSRFSRTLATLLRSGVPVLQALEITRDTTGNRVVSDALREVETSVREGQSLARPLTRFPVFPGMVVQMLAVGEETGAVDTMLEKVANFYDSEVDATVDALTSLIEPLLIVIIGVIVGGILISLYLPMFKLVDLIK
jgi:type IV pilus assembly protein PilC